MHLQALGKAIVIQRDAIFMKLRVMSLEIAAKWPDHRANVYLPR